MFIQDQYKLSKLRSAIKAKDGWWASLFSGPAANRLLELIVDIKWITPNHVTVFSFLIGVVAAYCFAIGTHLFLIIGAVLVQLSFIVDCMDGQLARYRQQFSTLGAWLDRVSDRVKDFLYFLGLALGIWEQAPDIEIGSWVVETWLVWPIAMLAMFVVFLIDYYVNQDMKLEPASYPATDEISSNAKPSLLSKILGFGLSVYKAIPILRFNIGEQALLISLFCFFDQAFALVAFFALLGSFYAIYWPVTKLKGVIPEK